MTDFQTEIEQRKAAEQERDRALIERALADIKIGLLTLQFHRWDDAETGKEFAAIWKHVKALANGEKGAGPIAALEAQQRLDWEKILHLEEQIAAQGGLS